MSKATPLQNVELDQPRLAARYGLLGLPLAFAALPLQVQLPAFYAEQLTLAVLGLLLLSMRLGDAAIDPWLGRLADRALHARGAALWASLCGAATLLVLAFWALFHPPAGVAALAWCALGLLLCYLPYSYLSVLHLAWAAALAGAPQRQVRLSAWRESCALLGVLIASVLPQRLGLGASALALALLLLPALLALRGVPTSTEPPAGPVTDRHEAAVSPWRTRGFAGLLTAFLLNGTAAALPATLLLFFVRDHLKTPEAADQYLLSYFLAAAVSLPLWTRVLRWLDTRRAWQLGMLLACLSFCWTLMLNAGDQAAFTLICICSGLALGADLCMAPALLAALLQREGLQGRAAGRFFGWWHAATKLSLALAAGLALPLLQAFGYQPGDASSAAGQQALLLAYGGLPCLLKLAALTLLQRGARHLSFA